MGGAAQHRVPCPHLVHTNCAADYCMGSRVSSSNLHFFLEEGRVHPDVSRADLEEWLGEADAAGGALVVCNSCDRVLQTDGGVSHIHHPGTCGVGDCDGERAESEPRTLPASWRADRFDQADRGATEHVGYAVLMVHGRFRGLHGDRAMIRVLYVDRTCSRTWYRDYEAHHDGEGYHPRAVEWSCTRSFPGAFGGAGDPVAGDEADGLWRLLDQQYDVDGADAQ